MSQKSEHYIGFLPQFEKPYWVGYCDIDEGYELENRNKNSPIND